MKNNKLTFTILMILVISLSYLMVGCSSKQEFTKTNPPKPISNINNNQEITKPAPIQNNTKNTSVIKNITQTTPQTPQKIIKTYLSDNASTFSNTEKISMSDGKQYFIVGEPKGHHLMTTKKIVFSIPGHSTTAESDYEAWQKHLIKINNTYAVASINWWDGKNDTTENYYKPEQMLKEINYFIKTREYEDSDIIILEGFSRGSANSYMVKAYDAISEHPVIDGVISASGKYQQDFQYQPIELKNNNLKLFNEIPWILVCGEKDPNPERDGCVGMSETKLFLDNKGANILFFMQDPNQAHGAFHLSSLGFVNQSLNLFDKQFKVNG